VAHEQSDNSCRECGKAWPCPVSALEAERDGLRAAMERICSTGEVMGEPDTRMLDLEDAQRVARAALQEHESTKPPLLTPGGRDLRAEYEVDGLRA